MIFQLSLLRLLLIYCQLDSIFVSKDYYDYSSYFLFFFTLFQVLQILSSVKFSSDQHSYEFIFILCSYLTKLQVCNEMYYYYYDTERLREKLKDFNLNLKQYHCFLYNHYKHLLSRREMEQIREMEHGDFFNSVMFDSNFFQYLCTNPSQKVWDVVPMLSR